MAEILNEVGDDAVDEEVVREVSKLVKESSDSVSPELVDTLGTPWKNVLLSGLANEQRFCFRGWSTNKMKVLYSKGEA